MNIHRLTWRPRLHALNPDTILPDGSRYRLYAQVTGTPNCATRVGNEGPINPGSRL